MVTGIRLTGLCFKPELEDRKRKKPDAVRGRAERLGMKGIPGPLGVAGGRAFSSIEGLEEDWESMSGGGLQAAAPGGLWVASLGPQQVPGGGVWAWSLRLVNSFSCSSHHSPLTK